MVVFPEGVALNYLSQRNNPLPVYAYNPPLLRLAGEETSISVLERNKVNYIIILQRETGEYGYSRFGLDYARKMSSWIYEHYRIVEQFGPAPFTSDEFSAVILKRKELP